MSTAIIQVNNLSKCYTISHEGRERYTALRDVLAQKAKGIFSSHRLKAHSNGKREEFWALKDVTFNINQGDRVGIIGRNGAGKSTLLKILSRIVEPTAGEIKIKGRVASLLEVGTGFHPELTGRENIFLNGAILGMSRAEVKKHFDAIVDFAETEKFLDTPVKRYSSGMYVRLAFAVAAHLEPEILVVDEVLAVGDAEFQKKCLGKMKDVSDKEGRTVLFVSHNMAAIKALCKEAVLMHLGKVSMHGKVADVVDNYLNVEDKPFAIDAIDAALHQYSTGEAYIRAVAIRSETGVSLNAVPFKTPIEVEINVEVISDIDDFIADIKVVSIEGIELAHSQSNMNNLSVLDLERGDHTFIAVIENQFQPGNYFLTIGLHHNSNGATIDYLETIIGFEVLNFTNTNEEDYLQKWQHGYFRPITQWKLIKK